MIAFAAFGTVAVLAAAPIVAVCIGARGFEEVDKPRPKTSIDDTMEIPRIRVKPKRYMR